MAIPDSELTLTSPLSASQDEAGRLLALTIQWHADRTRIGEQFMMAAPHTALAISRLSPLFGSPGTAALPLGHRSITRESVTLRLTDDVLRIDVPQGRMRMEVDGVDAGPGVAIAAARIERGVVLRLGSEIVLCLHWMEGLPQASGDPRIVGVGSAMTRVRLLAAQAARSDRPVLLLGETGTGKEVVAQAIHARRPPGSPFVAVNMATLNESLAAAELFGTAKGAYTGATTARSGLFAQADGGTLFLDEIGNTPLPVQPMLLRVLQSGEYRPVGGSADLRTSARLIAATDQDLDAAGFNQPLLRRLEGFVITLPPLRQRREDIGVLLASFLGADATLLDSFPAGLVSDLCCYDWPGNVRQLGSAAGRALIALTEGDTPTFEMLVRRRVGEPAAVTSPSVPPKTNAVPSRRPSALDHQAVLDAMDRSGWQILGAAQILGISRPSLYKLLETHPAVRAPQAIPLDELRGAVATHHADVARCAAALRTPAEALRRHLCACGLLG